MKRCRVCGETKPLNDFYRAAGMRDGYRNDCKSCNLAARAARYAENPQPYIDRVKRWQQANADRLNAYHREYRRRPGRKAADRDQYLKRKYGVSLEQYDSMLDVQGGVCRSAVNRGLKSGRCTWTTITRPVRSGVSCVSVATMPSAIFATTTTSPASSPTTSTATMSSPRAPDPERAR